MADIRQFIQLAYEMSSNKRNSDDRLDAMKVYLNKANGVHIRGWYTATGRDGIRFLASTNGTGTWAIVNNQLIKRS